MPGLTILRREELLDYLRTHYQIWVKLHLGPAGPNCTANQATETRRFQATMAAAAIVGNYVEIVSTVIVSWDAVATPGQDAIEVITALSLWPDDGTGGSPGPPIGRMPAGGFPPLSCAAVAATDLVTVNAPGFTQDNIVEAFAEPGGDPALTGTGLAPDVQYYVVNQIGGTFKLSLAQGGGPVDITQDCSFRLQRARRYPVITGTPVRIPVGKLAIAL